MGGVLANTIGQAFAVEALRQMDTNSLRSQGALEFLAKQQCDAATKGYFRPEFTPVGSSSPDQACDNAVVESEQLSDTETTATVLMMFYRLEEEDLVPLSAKGNAWTWLRNTQGRQVGSWSRTGDTSTIKNSKSTSLAGVAVSRDSVPSAALAALWIRGFQAFSPSPCATHLTDEGGAVAFEKVDFLDGELEGITPAQIDDWVDTTVYAADLLRFEDSAASVPALSGPTDYVEARKGVTLTIKNLDIGERICASGPSGNPRLISAKATSTSLKLYTPIGTGRRTFQVVGMQGSDTHTVYALDKTTLKLKIAKYYVKRGAKQKIKVSGLAPGERVTVKVKGSKLMRGVASASGKFQKKFKVKAKRGKVKIVVTGQFATRTNRIPFKVL